ncbi:hypothetical protein B0H13DRAFT_83726 [Mycena leptocephala]|nr:hypothetical protein B0H13DRAFT_83726 [Mycena leptocephala]
MHRGSRSGTSNASSPRVVPVWAKPINAHCDDLVFRANQHLIAVFRYRRWDSTGRHSNLTKLHIHGCRANRPTKFWRLWLPSLILHTLLYCLTAYRALKNRRLFKEAPILKRLVRDGGFFYFVVFISVLFTAIGSFLSQYPTVNIPAIFSNFTVVTTSIAASRVMLSIHSLAAKLGSDSAWLLNNIELSRVPWRRGATKAR